MAIVREKREKLIRKATQRDIKRQDAMQVEEPTLCKMRDSPSQTQEYSKKGWIHI